MELPSKAFLSLNDAAGPYSGMIGWKRLGTARLLRLSQKTHPRNNT